MKNEQMEGRLDKLRRRYRYAFRKGSKKQQQEANKLLVSLTEKSIKEGGT